ncbi:dethiobiotin synthase [Nocardioides sp.]|uniref:dethiobiotin synthase n=1 Tax=Nocardioides sp. TaxID=35761 RepID=UPI002735B818|nr:dethiobiotin synthase [Nocardioides sp.]MDP3889870.1 dethiobiotin synthase [Nocardioides sp.]
MSRVVVVTGTDTGVGKTVVTAALAVRARAAGSVHVVKPVQTGIDPTTAGSAQGQRADIDEIQRLTGCATQEYTCLADPLAPDTAARLRGNPIPPVAEYADRVRVLARFEETVLVEGAGGVLVRLDTQGGTILDLAADLQAEVVVVTRPSLGTLNHTELTVAACRAAGIEPAGLAIGSWPAHPGLAEQCNRDDLPAVTGVPLMGVVPAGAGALPREEFLARAPTWFR